MARRRGPWAFVQAGVNSPTSQLFFDTITRPSSQRQQGTQTHHMGVVCCQRSTLQVIIQWHLCPTPAILVSRPPHHRLSLYSCPETVSVSMVSARRALATEGRSLEQPSTDSCAIAIQTFPCRHLLSNQYDSHTSHFEHSDDLPPWCPPPPCFEGP